MKRIIGMIIFLVAILLFIGVMGLTAEATITVDNGAETITLTTDEYTLDEVWAADNVGNDNLTNLTNGIWRLNYSVIIDSGSLLINPNDGFGCIWLRLGVNDTSKHNSNITVQGTGRIYVNDTMITGWNNTADANLTWNSTFRPYIYIHSTGDVAPQPNASFNNSAIGYLGWDQDNQYGIVYECGDISGRYEPAGWMHNCTIIENFQGITFQGVTNMNVTNTWMNNTHESGITYTIDQVLGHGSHDGYIGEHRIWTGTRESVAVDYCSGDATANGIRLYGSDNMTMNNVNILDANTSGLTIDTCDNVDADGVTSYLNTEAPTDYNIHLTDVTNSYFDNCTAYSPEGTADGGNWMLTGTSYSNNFTTCIGYNTTDYEDFFVDTDTHNNTFTDCVANNSNFGFYCIGDNYNSFIDCVAHNHTLYDYKFYSSTHNTITNGYANDSAVGVYMYDEATWNTVTGIDVNRQASYAIQIGDTACVCHNNTIEAVTVTGTTTGDGIFVLSNCTYNYVGNSTVIDLTTNTSSGMGVKGWGSYNTFYNCDVNSSGGIGFHLLENSSENTINLCTADSDRYGIKLSGYTNNNTVNNSDFTNNNLYGILVNADAPSPGNNVFTYSTSNSNTYGICVDGSPLVSFTEVNAYNSSLYSVVVNNSGLAYFFDCIVYTATYYDWYIEDATDVDIYNRHILGFDKNINLQFDTVQPYGTCAHDPGDGLWELDTKRMTVNCNAEKDVYVNLTDWTGATYRKWFVTGVAGDYVYQKVGGLTAGILYDLWVNGQVVGTYTGQPVSMFGSDTGIVWFNYTGAWSTKYFEIKPHVDATDTTGATGISDTAITTTPPTPQVSTDTIITAIAVLFCVFIVGIALWFYYKK